MSNQPPSVEFVTLDSFDIGSGEFRTYGIRVDVRSSDPDGSVPAPDLIEVGPGGRRITHEKQARTINIALRRDEFEGEYKFTARVEDSDGAVAYKTYKLDYQIVNGNPQVSNKRLVDEGVEYPDRSPGDSNGGNQNLKRTAAAIAGVGALGLAISQLR